MDSDKGGSSRRHCHGDPLPEGSSSMSLMDLPNELLERILVELHPMEVVLLRQESHFAGSWDPSRPEQQANL